MGEITKEVWKNNIVKFTVFCVIASAALLPFFLIMHDLNMFDVTRMKLLITFSHLGFTIMFAWVGMMLYNINKNTKNKK